MANTLRHNAKEELANSPFNLSTAGSGGPRPLHREIVPEQGTREMCLALDMKQLIRHPFGDREQCRQDKGQSEI